MATEFPTTFDAAHRLGAYELAHLWADRTEWGLRPREAEAELAELAVMSGLAAWLTGWRPIQVHRALLAGASVEQVTAAYGANVAEVYEHWSTWVAGQRDLRNWTAGPLGVSDEEYTTVLARFREGGETR